jgi:hypothetical protein
VSSSREFSRISVGAQLVGGGLPMNCEVYNELVSHGIHKRDRTATHDRPSRAWMSRSALLARSRMQSHPRVADLAPFNPGPTAALRCGNTQIPAVTPINHRSANRGTNRLQTAALGFSGCVS